MHSMKMLAPEDAEHRITVVYLNQVKIAGR